MSDGAQVLKDGYGTPLAWLYTPEGKVLRDYDGQPISKYLTEFEYYYDEEGDDTCTMVFQFENVNSFNLPYFQQDVILLVKWGYVLPGGELLQSPTRKIAIRDLESEYKPDGIQLRLECTDLVSYLKGFQTKTKANYIDPSAASAVEAMDNIYDNVLMWLKEQKGPRYKATITVGKDALRIDNLGEMKSAEYDKNTGRYTVAKDNVRVIKDMSLIFKTDRTVRGNSQAITNAIEAQLKFINDRHKDRHDNQGNLFLDGTDDNIEIKYRNFQQDIWKSFTYYGGTGELISFTSNTNTRKIKSDIASNTNVNPFTKKIENTTISTFDMTSKGPIDITGNNIIGNNLDDGPKFIGPEREPKVVIQENLDKEYYKYHSNKKPNEQELRRHVETVIEAFEHDWKNPLDQKGIPDLKFTRNEIGADFYIGQRVDKPKTMTVPTKVLLNNPEFLPIAEEILSNKKSQFRRDSGLINYTVEKIQRKYEADAEVIGDPTLIKGKIININNVGRLDKGKWYIVSCRHTIKVGQGYTTEMGLMRNPSTVNIAVSHNAANPVFDKDNNKLDFEYSSDRAGYTFFRDTKDTGDNTVQNDEMVDNRGNERDNSSTSSINYRLEELQASDDFRNPHNDSRFSNNKDIKVSDSDNS